MQLWRIMKAFESLIKMMSSSTVAIEFDPFFHNCSQVSIPFDNSEIAFKFIKRDYISKVIPYPISISQSLAPRYEDFIIIVAPHRHPSTSPCRCRYGKGGNQGGVAMKVTVAIAGGADKEGGDDGFVGGGRLILQQPSIIDLVKEKCLCRSSYWWHNC